MTCFDGAGYGFKIDFRLARARDAVEQRDGESVGVDRAPQRLNRAFLICGELRGRVRRLRPREHTFGNCNFDQHAGRSQPIDHARRAGGEIGEIGFGAYEAVGGNFEHARSRRRHLRRRGCALDDRHAEAVFGRLECRIGAHHHADDHAEGRQGVAGDPFGEPHRNFG